MLMNFPISLFEKLSEEYSERFHFKISLGPQQQGDKCLYEIVDSGIGAPEADNFIIRSPVIVEARDKGALKKLMDVAYDYAEMVWTDESWGPYQDASEPPMDMQFQDDALIQSPVG